MRAGLPSLTRWMWIIVVTFMMLVTPSGARAHCDTLDGPVVKAARQALETGNVKFVLIWVQKSDEAEITSAFRKALDVRKLGPTAKSLADTFFFETLVRVHRAGEGVPFTGLKPAGTDLGPAVPAGDKALETGSIDVVVKMLTEDVRRGLQEQFKNVMAKKDFNKDDVVAGQQYVGAYVEYIHYVERIFEAATTPAHGHYPEPVSTDAHSGK
jgi:hypothetical protein